MARSSDSNRFVLDGKVTIVGVDPRVAGHVAPSDAPKNTVQDSDRIPSDGVTRGSNRVTPPTA